MHIPKSKYFPKFNSESLERKHKKKDIFNRAVFILNNYKSLLIGKIRARLKCENSRIIIEQNFLRIRSLPSITKSKQSADSRHLTRPFKPR